MTIKTKRKIYSEEFKEEALKLASNVVFPKSYLSKFLGYRMDVRWFVI